MPWVTLLVSLAVLTALVTVMALPTMRQRVLGTSKVGHALVPLIAAGLAWSTTAAFAIVKDQIARSSTPPPIVSAFVEDISFGLPEIPTAYRDHSMTDKEVQEFAARYKTHDETVRLSADEVARINDIANQSGMADPVASYTPYSMPQVVRLIEPPMAYYWEYTHWPPVLSGWSRALQPDAALGPQQAMLKFVSEVLSREMQGPGIFQALIGVANRDQLDFGPLRGDCQKAAVPGMTVDTDDDGKVFLTAPTFRMGLADADDPHRSELAKRLGALMTHACNRTLIRVFSQGGDVLAHESVLMGQYVQAWNDLLKSRKSQSLSLIATVSNLGTYDTFVRRDAKIVVGPRGAQSGGLATIVHGTVVRAASDNEQNAADGGSGDFYIRVPNRSAVTIEFKAHLADSLSEQLGGTYAGALNVLRLGLIVSTGNNERIVQSALTPFSSAARTNAAKMVEQMNIGLKN